MELLESRRLTGPSLVMDRPGPVLDVRCSADEAERLIPVWKTQVMRMHEALGWPEAFFAWRKLRGGISLAFAAPIDALYAATEINDWAWLASARQCGEDVEVPEFASALINVRATAEDEANPGLMRLAADAASRGMPLLWDDDEVSVGLGSGSLSWPVREIPDAVDWEQVHGIPVSLVTGTNGKTTTVRLAAHIARNAGTNVGLSSTDWIAVNDRIIDRGDWSGPGGARTVLRQPDVELAILESARGGLLRRGLGVERADAALITNIAADHLGDFGSSTVEELLDIKWIISRAVRESGRLILNADDPLLREKASDYDGGIVWFGLDSANPLIVAATANGELCFVLDDDELFKVERGTRERICGSREIPITMGGAARHNTANALAAAALSWCLGLSVRQIASGLRSMAQDENPGRCNIYDVAGVKVLVDFAHNPAAMRSLLHMAGAIPAKRRVLCFGQAGDRPDDLIREMTRDAWAIGLDRAIISELADYYRGRAKGVVHEIIRGELLACGASPSQLDHHDEELDSFTAAMAWAQPGDLVIMLALGGLAPIQERLRELGAEQSR